jgi:hypothetical protein
LNGRIFIDSSDLEQYQVSLSRLAAALATKFDMGRSPKELVNGRHWALGSIHGPRFWDIHLLRGVNWIDGEATFAHLSKGATNLLLTLSERVPGWIERSQCLPIASLLVAQAGSICVELPPLSAELRTENKHQRGGRPRLIDEPGARGLYEQGEALRRKHPEMTRAQIAANLTLPISTYKRYVRTFRPQLMRGP